MSVCFEASAVLTSSACATPAVSEAAAPPVTTTCATTAVEEEEPSLHSKNVAKILVTNNSVVSSSAVLQKVVNPPLITVLNSSGPITVVKSLCVTSVGSNAPQFTLVNSAPLTVTNALGKSPTITLLNTPVTVVKAIPSIPQNVEQCKSREVPMNIANNNNNVATVGPATSALETPSAIHNVFVKNTCSPDLVPASQDVPHGHKLLTANSFPPNVMSTVPTSSGPKTINGQKPVPNSKLKILSNVLTAAAGPSPNNLLLNKTNAQRYMPRQKLVSNGTATKYLNKAALSNSSKSPMPPMLRHMIDKTTQRSPYPTHKSQIKTMPPMNNFTPKPQGIKTLPPQNKNAIPGHVQRTSSGLRTIPPQRPPKLPNRPNYIGKHAIQAQKVKTMHNKIQKLKQHAGNQSNRFIPNNPVTFTQALTAEIIETLSHESGGSNSYGNKCYEQSMMRYENSFAYPEMKESASEVFLRPAEEKPQSSLNTLSLICHAVYLDHNYNATLPPDSPTRSSPPVNVAPQLNGIAGNSLYSPGASNRSTVTSTTAAPTISVLSSAPIFEPGNMRVPPKIIDDDAASDISCGSDHKNDTEGEETDTAPEAEAVNNEEQFDHYGDYVTRCICGFLHDDGYMIECDNCKVWQHVRCVVRNKQVPDEYLCEVCNPGKSVDRQKARLAQQQWMRESQLATEAKLRKEAKLKEQIKHKDMSDSDSSDGEHTNNNLLGKGRVGQSGRRKSEPPQRQSVTGTARQRRDSAKETNSGRKLTKRKERKMVRRKAKSQPKSHSDEDNQDTWTNSQLPQLRQWIDNYEEAVTNHYSPELRARISNIRINGTHSEFDGQMDPSVHKCRIHTQPLTGLKYLVTTNCLPPNTPVVELRGKYMLSTQHRNLGGALTTRQHAQRPGPFLFFYRLHRDNTEVCVDTRTYGNSARFIRRSCKPNAELRHCIEKGVLHLYVVTISEVEKNLELTIKHESHDLAAIGTTHIACACGNPADCTINRGAGKKNGDTNETLRKRRGRRTNSASADREMTAKVKDLSPILPPPAPEEVKKESDVKEEVEIKCEDTDVKVEKEEVKSEVEEVEEETNKPVAEKEEPVVKVEEVQIKEEEIEEERECESPPVVHTPIMTRRTSHKSESEEKKEPSPKEDKQRKLSREERKIEAIMKAFERMEKLQQRRQENQAKQAHRRESEPGPGKDDEKEPKIKRKRRKGRARTISTTSQAGRRNRVNSADSSYATSGDECMLSPNENSSHRDTMTSSRDSNSGQNSPDKAAGLLLSLSNGESSIRPEHKSPQHDMDSNSNSAHSSPETPMSSACLLIAAAVGPLEPGFKFPKTKKGLMNEWLNKSDVHPASSISPSSLTAHISAGAEFDSSSNYYTPSKNLSQNFCESPVQPRGSAKKRWLRQAISEDQCDSPSSRPESPPISEAVAPPKKRRLPRESLSSNTSPVTTLTGSAASLIDQISEETKAVSQEERVEIVYSTADGDSPPQPLESDAVLKERAAEMQQEFGGCVRLPEADCELPAKRAPSPVGCLMDPRLSRSRSFFSNSEHLVGTVEKTLSFLGFGDRKQENHLPAKRKLSITEYRQRKKLNTSDKTQEETISEENNLSQSPKALRARSNSSSSTTSFATSDEDSSFMDMPEKAPSAFNSEPTELERQRENVGLRLKKAFGLSVDDESKKPVLNVEKLLSCELPPVKTSVPLSSPTFPIPGSSEPINCSLRSSSPKEQTPPPRETPPPVVEEPVSESLAEKEEEVAEEKTVEEPNPALYYTPDDDEAENLVVKDTKYEEVEGTDYVPPFNNPLYPNSNFSSYGSVIDDDAPYEGRNPSPPPEMEASAGASPSYPLP